MERDSLLEERPESHWTGQGQVSPNSAAPIAVSPVADAACDEGESDDDTDVILSPPGIDDAERLAAFESVGTRLWPFVRYFALAGGHPDAIAAIADLAVLLGRDESGPSAAAEAAFRARNETLDSIATWFQSSKYYRLMVASSRDQFVLDLKSLKES